MKSRKKIAIGVMIIVLCLIVYLIFLLIHIREDNEKAMEAKLNNPQILFHGIFNTAKDLTDQTSIGSGEEICVFFNNENLNYDEKSLTFANYRKGTSESFNYYYINRPYDNQYDEAAGLKTTMFLCKYDDKGNLILLDGNNGEASRISVTAGKEDWLGRRELSYCWIRDGKKTPIYKRGDAPYSQDTKFLRSKYYSGRFLTVEEDF